MEGASVRESTATSAEGGPEMPEKNMLKSVTTCARPPRRCPIIAWLRFIMRPTTLAEVMSSPTSRKNGTARSASESMPLKSCAIIEGKLIGVSAVATRTPAIRLNATGTPRYPNARKRNPISKRIAPLLMADPLFVGQDVLWLGLGRFEAVAPAVPELLDCEQHDERTRERD